MMSGLVGRWRIVEAAAWPREHLDLYGPAFLRIDADGSGEMAFGVLTAVLNVGFTPSGLDFDWNGSDEGDHVPDNGWADLCDNGSFEGEIAYDNGDDTTFIAKSWPFQQPAKFILHRFDDEHAMVFATLVTHYWSNDGFLREGNAILDRMSEIAHIPAVLVHGRRDYSGPVVTAWNLHKLWPSSQLVIVEDEGHGGPACREQMRLAIDTFR